MTPLSARSWGPTGLEVTTKFSYIGRICEISKAVTSMDSYIQTGFNLVMVVSFVSSKISYPAIITDEVVQYPRKEFEKSRLFGFLHMERS